MLPDEAVEFPGILIVKNFGRINFAEIFFSRNLLSYTEWAANFVAITVL